MFNMTIHISYVHENFGDFLLYGCEITKHKGNSEVAPFGFYPFLFKASGPVFGWLCW